MVPLTAATAPIAIRSALQALLAGATLAVKSDSKNRANGHAGR
jgi:hypothetical protein